MNPHSAAVAGSGNPLKSRLESEIRAKIFSKSADPFAYSPPSTSLYVKDTTEVILKSKQCALERQRFGGLAIRLARPINISLNRNSTYDVHNID